MRGVGAGRDVITDFAGGSDRIVLDGIGATAFIGTNAFSGVAGELRYSGGANTVVEADLNGDRVADVQIELVGSIAPRWPRPARTHSSSALVGVATRRHCRR